MNELRLAPTLFAAGAYRAVELGSDDIPPLQRFFDRNPEYFLTVAGAAPTATEAHEEVHGALPAGWPFTRKWLVGFVEPTNALAGMASIVSDLLAPGVWHIGLLIVATPLHGSGVAQTMYEHLERFMRDSGAHWLRLGVVEGNARAERFWQRLAFVEVRKRTGVEMGKRVNTIRAMVKPLGGGTLPEYFALVARDRPDPC